MPPSVDEPSSGSLLLHITRSIRSPILLFSIAISVIVVTLVQQSAGTDMALPIGAVLFIFTVGLLAFMVSSKKGQETSSAAEVPIETVPNFQGQDLAVKVWVKHAESGKTGQAYRIGDAVRVCVQASRQCYLTLLNQGSDGELTILFPNRYNQNNRIEAGQEYEVPSDGYGFEIRLEEPVGIDRVKAIVTLDPKPLLETQFSPDGEFFQTVAPTATPRAMRVVAAEVKKRTEDGWAAASTQFEIVT